MPDLIYEPGISEDEKKNVSCQKAEQVKLTEALAKVKIPLFY
jgi:hypothetical protein